MMRRVIFLPKTAMNLIALYTGDHTVLETLKKYIDYEMIMRGLDPEKTLLYGPVQSGKTEAIVRIIKNPQYAGMNKILVIQNSLAVLKQYQQRLTGYGIPYHVIGAKSHLLSSLSVNDVLLLINNKNRYAHYLKMPCKPTHYIALMDESDMYSEGTHPVAKDALAQYYVTATPFHKTYKEGFFNRVSKIKPTEGYTGMKDVTITYKPLPESVAEFMSVSSGMMLINSASRINTMKNIAQELSSIYPDTPILLLNEKKWCYIQGTRLRIKESNISKIIDRYVGYSHIIFIANRLSLRGLSYTSSDYSRHLTHQFSNFKYSSVTSCLQKMRLLGRSGPNSGPRTLFLGEETEQMRTKMQKVINIIENVAEKMSVGTRGFNIRPKLARIV